MIEFVDLYNRWYITPCLSMSLERDINGKLYYCYIEVCWLNKAIIYNLVREK